MRIATILQFLLACLAVGGCMAPGHAAGNLADVTVYDRVQQRTLPIHFHGGRYYVAGQPGHEYQVRLHSRVGADLLAVVSVDGVNAVSGETAHRDQAGYVLGPRESYSISGWRKSLERVAAFFFTDHANSYAARTGRPAHTGVIGVALFRSRREPGVWQPPVPHGRRDACELPREQSERDGASGEAALDAAQSRLSPHAPSLDEKSLGTGHGRSETSVVRHAGFERASAAPDEIVTIYYDTHRNLVAMGVIRDTPRVARPEPFPGRFAPDPN